MRKIDPNRYEPLYSAQSKSPKPDDINISGIIPLKPRPKKKETKQPNKPSEQKSVHVHKKTSTKKNSLTSPATNKTEYVQSYLDLKPSTTSTFRLPQAIIDRFDDMYYQIMSSHKTKVTKYSLIVAALSLLMWDYEQHAEQSDLYQLLIKTPRKNNR